MFRTTRTSSSASWPTSPSARRAGSRPVQVEDDGTLVVRTDARPSASPSRGSRVAATSLWISAAQQCLLFGGRPPGARIRRLSRAPGQRTSLARLRRSGMSCRRRPRVQPLPVSRHPFARGTRRARSGSRRACTAACPVRDDRIPAEARFGDAGRDSSVRGERNSGVAGPERALERGHDRKPRPLERMRLFVPGVREQEAECEVPGEDLRVVREGALAEVVLVQQHLVVEEPERERERLPGAVAPGCDLVDEASAGSRGGRRGSLRNAAASRSQPSSVIRQRPACELKRLSQPSS